METVGILFDAAGADKYLNTLAQVAAAETKVASAADPAVTAINALDDTAAAAAADAAALGKSADKASTGVDDLGDAAKKGGKGVDKLGDDAEKSSKQVSLLDKITTGAGERIGHLLTDAAAQAGQAIVQFVGDTIDAAGDFESGMNRFASVAGDALGESGQSLEEFKDLFISLGRELPVSTAEVQQAAIEMAKGGIDPATIAAGGLRDVLDLAAAGEVGIAEAAEIASKQLGVWVDSAADATTKAAFLKDSVNLLSQAANASTVDVDDLALGLANSGKSADLAGVSFRETVTSMALISSGFSSAADAGTSFKTFLTRLQPQTDSQAEAFKRLNLLTAEGTSVFYDAQGSFIGMEQAAQILQTSLEGMGEAQKSAALNAAFGSDAIRAAGMLADAGAEGYRHMAEEMAKAGSAAVQAAKKQKGFNVAVDNMMGSLEAFQITVGSAVLPALTSLVNLLASGINAITNYAEATIAGETALAKIAGTVNDLVIPAIGGATAALIAYGIANASTILPGLVRQGLLLALNTAAWLANAVAVAAAAAPFVAIGLTIAAVGLKLQQYTDQLESATTQLLESKTWWNESTAAIEDFAIQTGEAKNQLAPFAATITELRSEIEADTKALGDHEAAYATFGEASGYTREQLDAELAAIVAKKDGLIITTQAYNEHQQAIIDTTAASMTASSQAAALQQAEVGLGEQASLTAKDIEELGKAIEKTFADGQQAVQDYATAYSEFASGVEGRAEEFKEQIAKLEKEKQEATTDEQRKGIDEQIKQVKENYAEQEKAAALSYAAQQTAQRQHLGQLLIDYTVSQATLGNISKTKAAEITSALEKEYGLQESSTATTFLNMAQSVDKFASDSGASIDSLIGDLNDQEDAAKETQKAMDDYAKEYTATQVNNFLEGKADADAYIESLESIPTEVNTTVTTTYRERRDERGDDPSQQSPGRASGGPIEAGRSYLVGEQGPEIITPDTSGYVTPTDAMRRAAPSLAQLGNLFGGMGATSVTNLYVDARGSSLTMADVTMAVRAGLAAEGREADIRVRTGAW